MTRLSWIQTREGWRSGRYQIELAAPQLWVLTRRAKSGLQPVHPATILRTGGSLREMKRAAAQLEWRRIRVRHIVAHLVAAALLTALTVILHTAGSSFFIAVAAALFAVILHTLVIWVDLVTGSAWSRLSDVYQ